MGLQFRMWLLMVLLFGILYGVITGIGNYLGVGSTSSYIILAILFMGFQYLVGPSLVSIMMRVKWVSEKEEPELHQMVTALSQKARIPKPKVGISQISIPNAFAFGRTQGDGRVCVTNGLLKLISRDELKGVLGHEISHIKHRDMAIITLLSAIPLILYWISYSFLWGRTDRREGGGYSALIGLGAMLLYFLTNLLVLYGSRIREYYADERSTKLGNPPHQLASALYKLVFASARLKKDPRLESELKRVEGLKAFFLNDVSRAPDEIKELKEIDKDFSGEISQAELVELRKKEIKVSGAEKLLEIFTTHPNMLKRIKRLATLT